MREPNISYMSHSRPAVCITSGVYDRRALDCTATVPLINSLTHLAYLTSTSPRIREILVTDGGLERLVRLLSTFDLPNDRRHLWKWSLAFQCVVNIGVRGTERIRTRVVEAGAVHIVTRVLENFLRAVDLARQQNLSQHKRDLQPIIVLSPATSRGYSVLHHPPPPADTIAHMLSMPPSSESSVPPPTRKSTKTSSSNTTTASIQSSSSSASASNTNNNNNNNNNDPSYRIPSTTTSIAYQHTNTLHDTSSSIHNNHHQYKNNNNNNEPIHSRTNGPRMVRHSSVTMHRRSTFPYMKIDATQRRRHRLIRVPTNPVSVWRDPRTSNIDNLFYREEDILLSLQLLAYLSKYPHIRNVFHSAYEMNVFSLVERFCHWLHAQQVQYWAGVIMRNACRKDETQGGIRRCANMHCGKWEKQQREFAKCRRCRKAKYCSKACQSRAWAEGHRWWCVERSESSHSTTSHHTATSVSSTHATAGTTTPPPTTTTNNNTTTATTTPTATNVGTGTTATTNHRMMPTTTTTTHGMTTTTTTVQDNGIINGIEMGDQPTQQQQQQSPVMMNTTSGVVTEDDTVQAMVDATTTRTIL